MDRMDRGHEDPRKVPPGEVTRAAMGALRWVTRAGRPAEGGLSWPRTTAPGSPLTDDLYDGTAGVLAALAEARLCGIGDFDDYARAAAGRLCALASQTAGTGRLPDLGLYTGLGGAAAALHLWWQASGEPAAGQAAGSLARAIARTTQAAGPLTPWRDVIAGEAGILLILAGIGDASTSPAVADLADRLVGQAVWIDGLPDWHPRASARAITPNFSHGAAGIGYALATASARLKRPDLLDVATMAARRLIRLGRRPDGTLAVPNRIPPPDPPAEPVSYGWCHGPTGTLRLFWLLDRLQPGCGWAGWAQAGRLAVRRSGLPARLRAGFWDNVGQCCGTAGVGEMAIDSYQESGDGGWLDWAAELAADVLGRRIADESGVRWSNTEHRLDPPDLEPELGWMQGAAGIAAWLLRLARVRGQGTDAPQLWWPDRPAPASARPDDTQ